MIHFKNNSCGFLVLCLFSVIGVALIGYDSPGETVVYENKILPGEYESQSLSTENLVVVTLDGLRWQEVFKGADQMLINNEELVTGNLKQLQQKYWTEDREQRRKKLMPFFWTELVEAGKLYGNRLLGSYVDVTNPYWFSYPGYNELWTGYPDTAVNSNDYPANPNPNVLEFINRQPGFKGEVVAFTSHKFFDRILNIERSNLKLNAGHEDTETYNLARSYMEEEHPRVMYIAFSGTDHHAHQKHYDLYLDAAHQADSLISNLWTYIQRDEFYKDKTTLFITTDHGRGLGINWFTHGSHHGLAHADEIWFAVAGPDTQSTGEQNGTKQFYQNQFAKTMAALLGLNFDTGNAMGEPIKSVMAR